MSRELLGVEPIELDGGHSPFLSRPAELRRSVLAARSAEPDVRSAPRRAGLP